MKIDLIALDLDGTLLTSQKRVSHAAADAIYAAQNQRGVRVVLATARPPRSTMSFYRELRLRTPMINYNGALVYDPPTGRFLLHKPIPVEISRHIISLARGRFPQMRVSAEIADRWCTDYYDPQYEVETAKTFSPDLVAPVDEWLTQPLTKLLLLGQAGWITQVEHDLARLFHGEVTSVKTEDYLLQVMHVSASKAEALRAVSEDLGIPRERVLAIGDNANDVGMLAWAGVGVAMGNSHPACLKVADAITESNDEDGVAHAIRRLVLDGLYPDRV